jgi:hypothetical protein
MALNEEAGDNGTMKTRDPATAGLLFEPLVSALQERLIPRGFIKHRRPDGVSFQQSDKVQRFVNLQRFRDSDAFGIAFEEIESSGKRRVALLEQLAGLACYSYKNQPFAKVMATALKHFDRFLPRWLSGEVFRDPTVKLDDRARAIATARAAFKRGDYAKAVHLLSEAERLAPLTEVDAQYLEIARLRAG